MLRQTLPACVTEDRAVGQVFSTDCRVLLSFICQPVVPVNDDSPCPHTFDIEPVTIRPCIPYTGWRSSSLSDMYIINTLCIFCNFDMHDSSWHGRICTSQRPVSLAAQHLTRYLAHNPSQGSIQYRKHRFLICFEPCPPAGLFSHHLRDDSAQIKKRLYYSFEQLCEDHKTSRRSETNHCVLRYIFALRRHWR
jgi:hypothetical protein